MKFIMRVIGFIMIILKFLKILEVAKEQSSRSEKKFTIKETVTCGSSLKFCLIAAGEADMYPRMGPTSEWDTAAGHAVLLASGGQMTQIDGSPFIYGKDDIKNPHFILKKPQKITLFQIHLPSFTAKEASSNVSVE